MANDIERLVLKGIITELPEDRRQKVESCAEKLRQVVAEYGQHGLIALALVVAEQDG